MRFFPSLPSAGESARSTSSEAERCISRRQLLVGDLRGSHIPLRPPWALPEKAFMHTCTACGSCVRACETGIIVEAGGGFPVVDFARGECSFCASCVEACQPAALSLSQAVPWHIRARLQPERCLAFAGVACHSCPDPCPTRAISMRPRFGGVARPQIDSERCNGCGACVSTCPGQAISMCEQANTEAAA